MSFTREASGIRLVATRYGDTLQRLALRELGDASKWAEVAALNGLSSPYIVNTKEELVPGVVLAGELLKVLAPSDVASFDTDPNALFGTDLLLTKGRLSFGSGNVDLVSGVKNLHQALEIRLRTWKKELLFHPEFGCWVESLIGRGATPATNQLAAFYVKSALLEEERVLSVDKLSSTVLGDSVTVEADITPIYSRTFEFRTVI